MSTKTKPAAETLTADAIARSASHNEIVTLRVHTWDDYDALTAALSALDDDHVYTGANGRQQDIEEDGRRSGMAEHWGTDDDGDEWRVHVILI